MSKRLKLTTDGTATVVGSFHAKPAVVIHETPSAIVIKVAGYRENPGSRYSGLSSYYPPETQVYKILSLIETSPLGNRILEVEHVISWENRRSKGGAQ